MWQEATKVDQSGRILLPASYRKALHLEPGDEVVLVLDADGVRLFSASAGIEHAQRLVRQYVPEGSLLSEELIMERRAEARRETNEPA